MRFKSMKTASGCDLHDVSRPLLSRWVTVLRSHSDAACDGEQGIGPSFRLSGPASLLATGRGVASAVIVVSGGPTIWPMRGDIDGPTFRCLSWLRAQPSGLLWLTGESSGYFMTKSPIARSLGRQWPPIESGVSPITAGVAGRIACPGRSLGSGVSPSSAVQGCPCRWQPFGAV